MRLVVIDTNVWVAAFLNRKGFPARIKDAWVNGEFEGVSSSPLLQEISEVCTVQGSKTNTLLVQFARLVCIPLRIFRVLRVLCGKGSTGNRKDRKVVAKSRKDKLHQYTTAPQFQASIQIVIS